MAKQKVHQKGMLRLNDKRLDEQGITLVELLAVLILMSFISIFTITLIVQSTETTDAIRIESSIRDEGDIIVSKLIKTLYETKEAHIIQNVTDNENSYLNVTSNPTLCQRDTSGNLILNTACTNSLMPIGFQTTDGKTKLYLKNEIYEVSNNYISIKNTSRISGDPTKVNSYKITLILQYKKRNNMKEIEFINQIQPF